MSMGGSSYSASNTETDASAQTSGNMTGNSADRVSQQFNNIGSGNSALDLNKYLRESNASFYSSISGEQNLDSGALGQLISNSKGNVFKYVALGSAVFLGLFAVIALKRRRS
jgi:hypothetical protein